MADEGDKPKIIIDEDWKSQVQAEKAAAKSQRAGEQPAEAAAPSSAQGPQAKEPPGGEFPPASFPMLLSTLATQAMMALGHVPHPMTGQSQVDRHQAKHFIDTIAVLEEKTKGNLTPHEAAMLTDLLHELRIAYVASGQEPGAGSQPPESDR